MTGETPIGGREAKREREEPRLERARPVVPREVRVDLHEDVVDEILEVPRLDAETAE